MANFVVETYVPRGDADRFARNVEGIHAALSSIVVAGRVHHVRSYLVPSDEMGFHIVEADRVEDVVRVTELASIEVERIVETVGIETDRRESGAWESVPSSERSSGVGESSHD